MTTLYLVRHCTNDFIEQGRLAGRMPGVSLNNAGKEQASCLAHDRELMAVQAIYSSPLERAMETAEPLARALAISVHVLADLNEVDFGDWTGKPYRDIAEDAGWKRFNKFRSGASAKGGESLVDVQFRMIRAANSIHVMHPDGTVLVVSHGDPIRALLCWSLGTPLDLIQRLAVDCASCSTIVLGDYGPRVTALNRCTAT